MEESISGWTTKYGSGIDRRDDHMARTASRCAHSLLLASLIMSTTTHATENKTTKTVIILQGGKAHNAGQHWLDANQASLQILSNTLHLAQGFPKALQSDGVQGLNPGYNIAVAGFCASRKVARQRLNRVRRQFPQAYLRQVQVPSTWESCPTPKSQSKEGWRTVQAGYIHSCGIKNSGLAACWGGNVLEQASPPTTILKQLSTGMYHTCGLTGDGTLVRWGSKNGPYKGNATPNLPADPEKKFSQISAGDGHTCGLLPDGQILCWGHQKDIQAGVPKGVFIQVALGYDHACALRQDGAVYCWGGPIPDTQTAQPEPMPGGEQDFCLGNAISQGLLKEGQQLESAQPAWKGPWPTGPFVKLSSGGSHSCGLRKDGSHACWGSLSIGDGCKMPFSQLASAFDGEATQIEAGLTDICAMDKSGAVFCWPNMKSPKGHFSSIDVGGFHACGLLTDGRIHCWGSNQFGAAKAPEQG